ncbi:MAG: bifunctional hydroxymethylpyrimidine kinase/phosphomethylpyrimidine kinase [Deltaproteobacteria bacterium]|nr:bifunctional hydroxymethylpyrimidine kinase/phosphomethylpyrimidine kinase [Deltaproteobacteria bacterium]
MKTILIIAGSDPSSGAGLPADLKTCHAQNVHALAVITAVTAQNSKKFLSVNPVKASVLEDQLRAIESIPFQAIKIGMLGTAANVRVAAQFLTRFKKIPVILDPIFQSTTGAILLERKGIPILRNKLMPLCTLITPNLAEAELLTGQKIRSIEEMKNAARIIHAKHVGLKAVLIKGGHLAKSATDVLYDGSSFQLYKAKQRFPRDVHGTGCVLSTVIATSLADGYSLKDSIGLGKKFVTRFIRSH